MEEYIREAPRIAHVAHKTIEYRHLDYTANQEEEEPPQLPHELASEEEPAMEEPLPEPVEEPHLAAEPDDEPEPTTTTADLLGLHEVSSAAAEIEESNALALAIVPPGGGNTSFSAVDMAGSSGWELALVAAPTNSSNQLTEMKLAGGFDKLLLDSLYEGAASRQQATTDPPRDPFAVSTSVAPPTNVQMSMMAQQQQYYQQQQQEMFGMPQPFQPQYAAAAAAAATQANPFGDTYSALSQSAPLHGSSSLI